MIQFASKKMFSGIALAVTAFISVNANAAVLNSNAPTVSLTASLAESLSVSSTVSSVSFTLANGQTVAGSAAVPITANWVLNPSRTDVKLYGYFASSAAALTDGLSTPDNIPAADVLGQVTTGAATSFTPFSATGPSGFGAASAALLLWDQPISGSGNGKYVGTRTDNLSLEINTPASLPAGSYSGTLTIQAQAN